MGTKALRCLCIFQERKGHLDYAGIPSLPLGAHDTPMLGSLAVWITVCLTPAIFCCCLRRAGLDYRMTHLGQSHLHGVLAHYFPRLATMSAGVPTASRICKAIICREREIE